MLKLIGWFFTVFGIISFISLLGLGYGWVTDVYGVRTASTALVEMFRTQRAPAEVVNQDNYPTPNLTPEQQSVLEDVGIDPNSIPTSLTAEQEQCMVEKIGQDRVEAVKAGDTPTTKEILAGASCL